MKYYIFTGRLARAMPSRIRSGPKGSSRSEIASGRVQSSIFIKIADVILSGDRRVHANGQINGNRLIIQHFNHTTGLDREIGFKKGI